MSSNPAENLLTQRKLEGGWEVVEKIPKSQGLTGGNFSVGYIVADDSGNRAFLKALDFSEALRQPNPTVVLQSLTSTFIYERMVLGKCRSNKLDRVAVSIADGEIPVGTLHSILPVPYLIFDLAEGDIRSRLDQYEQFELAFCLRTLHHCAVGLRQLHTIKVAHQDLKPSNVLVFSDNDSRVSDLGRSTVQGMTSPTDDEFVPGDTTYAPPELLYGLVSSKWQVRRLACDLYHLGSLAVFFFTKVGITATWHRFLDRSFWPASWGQSYEDALPYVRDAHDLAFVEFESQVPDDIRAGLCESVKELCEPDPLLRGHPRDRGPNGNPYSLERYISRFDLLARRAEWQMKRTRV